ncbi:hypothetical protein [Devosia sp.]|uniref:hypothetical protein n=1 Tax=Devosia sp. TaxID=1871048 RepID=UPI003264769F
MKFALAGLLLLAIAPVNAAEISRCLIAVDGATYLDGPCNLDREDAFDFSIGTEGDGQKASKYFAYVQGDAQEVVGYWNGIAADSHAADALGPLQRNGDCWENARAQICATP